MAAPTITAIYPSNNATSVPVGANIEITFSTALDLSTVKNNIVLYGKDFDFASGPDTAVYFNEDGTNKEFLKSPGFKGVVKCDYELVYIDSNGDTVSLEPTSISDESAGPYTHKVIIKPKTILSPDLDYNLYIIGEDESGTNKGISTRTVYEVDSSGATGTTGVMHVYGGYKGESHETVNVKITTGGNIGTAEYKWWYSTDVESNATTGKVTSRRFRKLDKGIQIRFTGSSFVVDDVYTVNVRAKEMLEQSYTSSFSTSNTEVTQLPDTTSTSVIGTSVSSVSGVPLSIIDVTPADGASHQKFSDRKITIEFSATLDSTTVTQDSVTVLSYPISGIISSADEESELFKKLTVDSNKIIIDL
jgi:hypothetical protein